MSEIIVNTSQARSLEQLSDVEKKQVEEKLISLDYMNPLSIIQFGSEIRYSKNTTGYSVNYYSLSAGFSYVEIPLKEE